MVAAKNNRSALKARDANVQNGIDKDLAKMATIQLAGTAYKPAALTALFQADADAMAATDAARAALSQAVAKEKAVHKQTQVVYSALRSFLIGYFGKQAVATLGDFGMTAPKTTATKTVTTKAVAVAKAKATRAARGTKGPKAKLDTTGTVDEQAIESAINTPNATPSPGTGTAAPAGSGTSSAPASPAPTPAVAPKAGS